MLSAKALHSSELYAAHELLHNRLHLHQHGAAWIMSCPSKLCVVMKTERLKLCMHLPAALPAHVTGEAEGAASPGGCANDKLHTGMAGFQ